MARKLLVDKLLVDKWSQVMRLAISVAVRQLASEARKFCVILLKRRIGTLLPEREREREREKDNEPISALLLFNDNRRVTGGLLFLL